jgi:hypothetical protein
MAEFNKIMRGGYQKIKIKLPITKLDPTFNSDCSGYNDIPLVIPAVKRIIAIGDIHGDLNLALESLRLAKVINDSDKWIGKDTIVVQVGDQIDSCRPTPDNDCHNTKTTGDDNSDMKILELFNRLDLEAINDGGRVISLIGNHEIMNSQGNFDYVSNENMEGFYFKASDGEEFKGLSGRTKAFERGGPVAKMIACTRPSSVIVGDHLFVHAGILPTLIRRLEKMGAGSLTMQNEISKSLVQYAYLNEVVRKWLLNKFNDNADIRSILTSSKTSPFWPRIYGNIKPGEPYNNKMCQVHLKPVLDTLKIGHMIIGHTPQGFDDDNSINATCGDKVFRVDGGFAKAFKFFSHRSKNKLQVLEILDDSKYNILTKTF